MFNYFLNKRVYIYILLNIFGGDDDKRKLAIYGTVTTVNSMIAEWKERSS